MLNMVGIVFIMSAYNYCKQLDVCALHCESFRFIKQDESLKNYLKNKNDGVLIYTLN